MREATLRLTLLLRLAVRLNRARSARATLLPRLTVRERSIELAFPSGWLAARPMTRADLEEESAYFDDVGYALALR